MPAFRRHLPLAIATALLVAIPASAQKSAVETQVWIDVATHDLVGMPDMGPVSGIARAMTARGRPRGYPQSRNIPADTGNILDIAMHNTLRPGVAAEQLVPAGLGVGKSIPLLPPPPGERSEGGEDSTLPEVEVTLHQYWGCGATVRPGQPKTMTLRIKGGKVGVDGSIARGQYVPDRDIDKWLKQKVLLAPATTSCAIPQGIFAAKQQSGEDRGVAGLNMIAYGPETNITWPPRPADPKQPWDPEWNVRVRTKATATAVLGVDFAGMEGMESDGEREPSKPEEGKGKKLLRGLLRSF